MRQELLGDAHIIVYADDLAVLVAASTEVVEEIANNAVEMIRSWLDNKGMAWPHIRPLL